MCSSDGSVPWCNSPTSARPVPRPQTLPPSLLGHGTGRLLHPPHSLPWKAWAWGLCSLQYKVRFPRPPARLESKDRGCIFPYCACALNARLKVKCFSRNLARRESATEDPARPTRSLRLSLSCARRRAEVKKVNLQDFRTFSQSFLAAVLGEERLLVVN